MQIENLWKIVDRRTGEKLTEPRVDFSEFTTGDILYPSMMKPEVKRRWDQKQYEKEETKAIHAKLKRMVHAQFMEQNPNLPVVQKLKQTTYGNEIQTEFKKHLSGGDSMLKPKAIPPRSPQIGTGKSIRDELERENVDINKIGDEILQFLTPKTEETYAVLAVNRDENLRIEDKIIVSAESSHVLEYQYDEGGRLQAVKYSGNPVEIYRYNQLGQRTYSHVSGSDKLKYQYNDLGQLVRVGDTTYTYDADGDLSEKNSPEGTTRYEYLETGQLCEVHLPDGTGIEYSFDERGFRTAKYISGQLIQKYQWHDLVTLAAAEDAEGISKFHYNEHGRCMGMERKGQVFLFATDQLGSIFTVADSSGNSVHEILYDSFGRRIQNSNPEHDLVLGFGGGLYDSDTGLVHFGYREYDPVIGRFISPDPLGYEGGDVDLYGFCWDDPVNFADHNGLFVVPLAGGAIGAAYNAYDAYDDWKAGKISDKKYALLIGLGGATGAASTAGTGVFTSVVAGGLTSAANEAGKQKIKDGEIKDWEKVTDSAKSGAIGGAVGKGAEKLGKNIIKFPKEETIPVKQLRDYGNLGGITGSTAGNEIGKRAVENNDKNATKTAKKKSASKDKKDTTKDETNQKKGH